MMLMAGKRPQDDKIGLGWKVRETIKDRFVDYCISVGSQRQDACAGALVVWEFLSPRIREAAVRVAKGAATLEDVKQAIRTDGLAGTLLKDARHDRLEQQQDQARSTPIAGKPRRAAGKRA